MALEKPAIGLELPYSEPLMYDDVLNNSWATIGLIAVGLSLLLVVCCRCRVGKERDVDPVPYTCLSIDSTWRDLLALVRWFLRSFRQKKRDVEREIFLKEIADLCRSSSSPQHQNPILVSVSVKTSLDLFFRVQKYPPGSEVIVTSINARDTIQVLLHHGLHVVPLDVTRDKLGPDIESLRLLITERTVAILVTHLYGRLCDLTETADIAHEHGIHVLEDCTQSCTTPAHSANPESDVTFFSFDVVHHCTAFGGAITRIKDKYLLPKMDELLESYPTGSERNYIQKVFKCTLAATMLNNPRVNTLILYLAKLFKLDSKDKINAFLTAPPSAGLLRQLRVLPPTSLLFMLHRRLQSFNPAHFERSLEAGNYVTNRLPQVAGQIGMKALARGYWLFPILVDEPDEVIPRLNRLGIDAARETAQIGLITRPSSSCDQDTPLDGVDSSRSPPSTAAFIMDHLIYLPVHKRVPKHDLDQVCLAVEIVLNKLAILRRFRWNAENGREPRDNPHPGPYGPNSSRRGKESTRRRNVTFNPSVAMVSQVQPQNSGENQAQR